MLVVDAMADCITLNDLDAHDVGGNRLAVGRLDVTWRNDGN